MRYPNTDERTSTEFFQITDRHRALVRELFHKQLEAKANEGHQSTGAMGARGNLAKSELMVDPLVLRIQQEVERRNLVRVKKNEKQLTFDELIARLKSPIWHKIDQMLGNETFDSI